MYNDRELVILNTIKSLDITPTMFKNANEREKKRLAIVHFYESYFKDITPKKKEKPYIPSTKESIEWDDEAQQELEDIQGADPYLMLY